MSFAGAVVDRLDQEVDEFEVYRKGRVQAIDKTGDLWKVRVSERWMPYVDETIDVGDIVIFVDDFEDPFAWVEFEEAGNWTGTTISGRGGTWFTNGDGTEVWAGTTYDYDQDDSILLLDSIKIPPQSRISPLDSSVGWTGGVVFYRYRAAVASTGAADFLKTDISGDDLTPSSHLNWDGTIVPALAGGVDEYTNLGGTMSLRTHLSDIGAVDLPGAHAHLVEPLDKSVDNLQSAAMTVVREVESVVVKNIATELTTIEAGVDLAWPVPLTAPGKDWLMLFLVEVKPLIGGPLTSLPKLDLVEPVGAEYSIYGVASGGNEIAANTGSFSRRGGPGSQGITLQR